MPGHHFFHDKTFQPNAYIIIIFYTLHLHNPRTTNTVVVGIGLVCAHFVRTNRSSEAIVQRSAISATPFVQHRERLPTTHHALRDGLITVHQPFFPTKHCAFEPTSRETELLPLLWVGADAEYPTLLLKALLGDQHVSAGTRSYAAPAGAVDALVAVQDQQVNGDRCFSPRGPPRSSSMMIGVSAGRLGTILRAGRHESRRW